MANSARPMRHPQRYRSSKMASAVSICLCAAGRSAGTGSAVTAAGAGAQLHGRSSGPTTVLPRTEKYSTRFRNSRTFPGHGYARKKSRRAGESANLACLCSIKKRNSSGMSSLRSRSGGIRRRQNAEPVIKVFSESSLRHSLVHILIGRRDDPHIHICGVVPPTRMTSCS